MGFAISLEFMVKQGSGGGPVNFLICGARRAFGLTGDGQSLVEHLSSPTVTRAANKLSLAY